MPKLQEKTSDFHVNFHDCVYLSIGPEAKRDIYNTFDPDKPFNIHLDPPSKEHPPLVEIKQEGKASVYTIDFYFTNKLPSNITVWSPGENNSTPTGDQATAADPTLTQILYSQERFVYIRGCYTHHKHLPVLDFTEEHRYRSRLSCS